MSDPVTNIAIEDVLSSIRRLVSEGDRPRTHDVLAVGPVFSHAAAAVSQMNSAVQSSVLTDKFVLTPAFRVAGAATAKPAASAIQPTGSNDNVAQHNRPLPLVNPAPTAPESRSPLELRIAELEAAVTRQADDWEPDGSEEVPVVDWSSAAPAEGFVFVSRGIVDAKPAGVLDLGTAGVRIDPVLAPVPAEAHTPVQGAPHVAFRRARPDTAMEEDDPLGSGDGLADDLDRSDAGEFAGTMDQELTSFMDEAGVIDEETLRNLVIEIVRQELQGTLGERITRNVRKLVRREIYRVLASQEFE